MRVLLVTNDFPPTIGGIQSYLRDFLATLNPENVVVFASTQDAAAARQWDAAAPYRVYRWHRRVMLPTPATVRRMQEIIREENIDVVWFGAAAPLGLMARFARSAGAARVVASTHGHEVGWSMLPGARQLLRVIGRRCDIVTYISDYTLGRFRSAFGDTIFAHLPSGVHTDRFSPLSEQERDLTRRRLGLDPTGPVVVCVSRLVPRKGQDHLLAVWPEVVAEFTEATLVLVGSGPYRNRLTRMAQSCPHGSVRFTGRVSEADLADFVRCAEVFAMPCRTRGGGLDVEGLGIVFLEAQAAGIPVIAGDSGGAPETVTSDSGIVVAGRSKKQLFDALRLLLSTPQLRQHMSAAGQHHVADNWTWEIMGARLRRILFG
ncbi:MAG: glycosyltransferase family 4 protein [Corynebacterium sp.]|uniref:glycosyltransferase family 4 protein n=1 Tax=Corynebacterium sp. TaxID=1720 RepID=UPI0026DAD642|nr:glycosyltransferase family 4 protein [Corynebacterium sp.]MDO5097889.1 glycosyltransferase family 4 protein [Corynebacterium sp.]